MAVGQVSRAAELSRSSPEPLYRQLAQVIEGEIRSGQIKAGERIASEDALAARFSVSRITVRQAVAELARQKLLLRKQGKGTFVTIPAVRHNLRRLHGLVGSLFAQAPNASMRLLRYELCVPPDDVAEMFGLAPRAPALALDRLYLVGDKPVALGEDWLVPEVATVPRGKADLISTEDLMRLVGIRIGHSETSVRAEHAGSSTGGLLGISPRAPLLILRRRAFAEDGSVKEFGKLSFRSESYEFFYSTQDTRPADESIAIRNVDTTA